MADSSALIARRRQCAAGTGAAQAMAAPVDAWLAQAIDLLSLDARWKRNYDALAPIRFAFIGPRRGRAVAGHRRDPRRGGRDADVDDADPRGAGHLRQARRPEIVVPALG